MSLLFYLKNGDLMDKIRISDVTIGRRYRKDLKDIEGLAASLAKYGQIQPIVLDGENALIAGERRLTAAKSLGWDEIGYVRKADLDDLAKKEVEIEENLRREAFEWWEEVLALEEVYNIKRGKYGAAVQGVKGGTGFGLKQASGELDRSIGSLSMDLSLAAGLREYPELADERSKTAAFRRYKRLKEKALREEIAKRDRGYLEDVLDKKSPADDIMAQLDSKEGEKSAIQRLIKTGFKGHGIVYSGDAEFVVRYLPDHSVDVIVTDPPYALGLGTASGSTSGKRLAQHEGALYDDDPFEVINKLSLIFAECSRVLKSSGHAYVFFHHNWYHEIYQMLCRSFHEKPDGPTIVHTQPIIWSKNTSGIGDPNERWAPSYEPCFFVNRGRPLVTPQPFNVLSVPTVPPNKKTHPTEKPTELLRRIIQASAVRGETVFDPFSGSGSTLVAALEVGCTFVGVELDPTYYHRIVERLSLRIGELDKNTPEKETEDATDATT